MTFVLKNPAMTQEVSVTVPLDGDVAGLKASIRDAYPGSPSTSQLIVSAGHRGCRDQQAPPIRDAQGMTPPTQLS